MPLQPLCPPTAVARAWASPTWSHWTPRACITLSSSSTVPAAKKVGQTHPLFDYYRDPSLCLPPVSGVPHRKRPHPQPVSRVPHRLATEETQASVSPSPVSYTEPQPVSRVPRRLTADETPSQPVLNSRIPCPASRVPYQPATKRKSPQHLCVPYSLSA